LTERNPVTRETEPDPHENQPTTVVFDLFAETANKLVGAYSHLADEASAADRAAWWSKALAVRDTRQAVRADDRAALLAHIQTWQAELDRIEADARGCGRGLLPDGAATA
jgi:hypothetical protein